MWGERTIHITGGLCAALYVWLAVYSPQVTGVSLVHFLAIMALTTSFTFCLYFYLRNNHTKLSIISVLAWAVVFRAIGIAGAPILEDDFYRYLWDGCVFVNTGSPYGSPPAAFFDSSSLPDFCNDLIGRINHPDIATIYGPVLEYLFALGYLISPANIFVLKFIFVVTDILLICLLLKLAPVRYVMLYAWCPLVIKEIAFTAHPDIIGVLLIIYAFVVLARRQLTVAAVCCALAVGAKVFALLLVPFVLHRCRSVHWLIFIAVLLGLYAPFVMQGDTDIRVLGLFASTFEFNSSIYALLKTVLTSETARVTVAVIVAVFWLFYFYKQGQQQLMNTLPRGDILYGVFFLLSPIVNPWYLVWVLPFAVVYPSPWAWTASVAVLLSYVIGLHWPGSGLSAYQSPVWIYWLEYGVIAIAVFAKIYLHKRRA